MVLINHCTPGNSDIETCTINIDGAYDLYFLGTYVDSSGEVSEFYGDVTEMTSSNYNFIKGSVFSIIDENYHYSLNGIEVDGADYITNAFEDGIIWFKLVDDTVTFVFFDHINP